MSDSGLADAKRVRCLGEATCLDHADEGLHRIKSIHYKSLNNAVCEGAMPEVSDDKRRLACFLAGGG
jgi:hypothetical protein